MIDNDKRIESMEEFSEIMSLEQYVKHALAFGELDNDNVKTVLEAFENEEFIYMCEDNESVYTKDDVLDAYYRDVEYRLNDYSYSYDYMLITDYIGWYDRLEKLNRFDKGSRLRSETPKLVKALQGRGLAYIDRDARVFTLDEVELKNDN